MASPKTSCFLCLIQVFFCGCFTTLGYAQATKGKEVSCTETATRVLAPFIESVAKADAAIAVFDKKNTELINYLRGRVALFKDAYLQFSKKQKEELQRFNQCLQWAREAVAEATEILQKRIAGQRGLAAKARAAGDERAAKRYEAAARKLEQQLAQGFAAVFKRELNLRRNVAGWKQWIAKESSRKRDRMAAFAAGAVPLFIRPFNTTYTVNRLRVADQKEGDALAIAVARRKPHFLGPINQTLDGEGLKTVVKLRRDALMEAKAEISAGTFGLFVGVINKQSSRNAVQKLISDAKAVYRKTRRDWTMKSFKHFNPKLHRHSTNGEIEKMIADRQKALAEFLAKGDSAKVFASGSMRTKQSVRDALESAVVSGNQRAIAFYKKGLTDWQVAHRAAQVKMKEGVAHYEEVLREHEHQLKENLKKQKARIDGKLRLALASTPCGGGGAVPASDALELVRRHLQKLKGMSEDEAEEKRRRGDYEDRLHVEGDGTVHGDPREAWMWAVKDVYQGKKSESLAEQIIKLKDLVEWIAGFADSYEGGAEVLKAKALIDELVNAMASLDPKTMGAKAFFRQRRLIRGKMLKFQEALETGFLSSKRARGYLDALMKGGSGTRATQQKIEQMKRFIKARDAIFSTWKAPGVRGFMQALKESGQGAAAATAAGAKNALADYQTFVQGSSVQVAGRMDSWWKGQSAFQKGVIFLSVANAAANTYTQIQNGVAPSEAIGRCSVDLVIDFVVAGVPVLAAAEMLTQVFFTSYAAVSGEQDYDKAVLSDTAKELAKRAIDKFVSGVNALGTYSVALERFVQNEPSLPEILANVDAVRLRNSLSAVEDQLDVLPPGHEDEARLLRMRFAFRRLLRAKQE